MLSLPEVATITITIRMSREEEKMSINPFIRCCNGSHKSGCIQKSQMNNFCRGQKSHLNPAGLWTVPAATTPSFGATFDFWSSEKPTVINQPNLSVGKQKFPF